MPTLDDLDAFDTAADIAYDEKQQRIADDESEARMIESLEKIEASVTRMVESGDWK